MKKLPITFQRTENGVLAVLILIAFVYLGFYWYIPILLFLLVDISAAGYAVNNRVGAITYNIGHSYIGPAIAMMVYVPTHNKAWAFVALLWAFHIAVDRALGYGLKEAKGFEHTHLGLIGKAKK